MQEPCQINWKRAFETVPCMQRVKIDEPWGYNAVLKNHSSSVHSCGGMQPLGLTGSQSLDLFQDIFIVSLNPVQSLRNLYNILESLNGNGKPTMFSVIPSKEYCSPPPNTFVANLSSKILVSHKCNGLSSGLQLISSPHVTEKSCN